jgi:hypothetical protein
VYDRMDGGWFNGATRSHRDDAVVDEWLSLEVDGHKEPLMMEAGPCRVEVSGERAEVVVTLSWSRKNATLYATDGAGGMALPLLPLEPSSHPMTLCAIP